MFQMLDDVLWSNEFNNLVQAQEQFAFDIQIPRVFIADLRDFVSFLFLLRPDTALQVLRGTLNMRFAIFNIGL